MGSYANWADVVARYPKSGTVADSQEMSDSFINGTEALMNSYLAKVFTVPVTGEPSLLKEICVDLVYTKIAFNKDKGVPKLREETLALLKKIIDGEVLLVDSAGLTIPVLGEDVWSSTEDYFHTFSMLGHEADLVDPDLLEDLSDERS